MSHSCSNTGIFINYRKPLVSILWDYQNVPQKNNSDALLKFANSKGNLIDYKVYDNWENPNCKETKKFLEGQGWECVNVQNKIKNAVDFKITREFGRLSSSSLSPNIFIIISGDQFVEILIEDLPQSRQGIVFARKGSYHPKIKQIAHEFQFIEDFVKK